MMYDAVCDKLLLFFEVGGASMGGFLYVQIVEFHYPSDSISLAFERLKLSALLATHGDTREARTFREQAHPIIEAHYGPGS